VGGSQTKEILGDRPRFIVRVPERNAPAAVSITSKLLVLLQEMIGTATGTIVDALERETSIGWKDYLGREGLQTVKRTNSSNSN
jgi:hypothetical protein